MDAKIIQQNIEGHCPYCGKSISLWTVVKPTIRPNRFPCNHCGGKLKYIYPLWYFIILQVLGFFAGIFSAFVGFVIVISLMPTKLIASTNMLFAFSIPVIVFLVIIVVIGLGYCVANYSKTRYKLAKVKSS